MEDLPELARTVLGFEIYTLGGIMNILDELVSEQPTRIIYDKVLVPSISVNHQDGVQKPYFGISISVVASELNFGIKL